MLPQASAPDGFAQWKGDAVKKSGEELATQLDDQKFGWKALGTYGNHYMGISRREGDGSAEVHETRLDVWIVQDGEATACGRNHCPTENGEAPRNSRYFD